MSEKLTYHPIANIFPLLNEEDLSRLADDIRKHGLLEPIMLFEDMVLDGRNRCTACKIAGVEPEFYEFEGTHGEAVEFVWSMNFIRRQLDPGQAAVAHAKREKYDLEYAAKVEKIKAEAAKRKKATLKQGDKKAPVSQLVDERGDPNATRTDAALARTAGTNRRYLEAARTMLDESPERLEAVEKGEKTLSQVIREVNREKNQAKIPELPKGKYRVIYADPPWNYGSSGSGLEQYGPAERHYPSMTIKELCDMDIQGIAANDAVLFMWVTSPLLGECFPIIKAWGFTYKTCFIWDKIKHNFGHYNSVRHELLLICTRGSCTPDSKKLHDSVVSLERTGKHSEKPEFFRELIEGMYTQGKRIELFARIKAKGWKAYGNEL